MMTVYVVCLGEWINTETVDILDVEEGPQGQDVVTFKCPHCEVNHKSEVRRK